MSFYLAGFHVSVLDASPDITRQIVDAAGEMIIATTLDGTITFLNARAQSVYGWSAQEAIGQNVADLFVPADAAPDAQAIMDRVTRGEIWSGDFEVRRRDGSTFPAHVVDAPIFGSDGAVVGIVGVSTDISDLVRERENLQKANQAKDEFIALVSHELKSPITTIVGNAAVLRRAFQSLDVETIGQALQDIKESGERLDQIVDDLLVLARLDQGEEVETEPLLLFRFAEGLVDEHRKRFPHRTITLDAAGDPRPVLANEFYLAQVLRNLIGNAEKYSPADAPIALNVERTEDEVRFTIRDRGTGIPVAEQTAIFEPFYRSRASRSAKGVGIGLTVCRRLMDAQHGKIWVRNHEDGGAEFGISLPIDSHAVANDANPARSLQRQNGQR